MVKEHFPELLLRFGLRLPIRISHSRNAEKRISHFHLGTIIGSGESE